MKNPIIIALLTGLLTGCAELPLRDAAHIDVTPRDTAHAEIAHSDSATLASNEPQANDAFHGPLVSALQTADYRTVGEHPQLPLVLTGTPFDGDAFTDAGRAGSRNSTAGFGNTVVDLSVPASHEEATSWNPEVQTLPPVDGQVSPSVFSMPETPDGQKDSGTKSEGKPSPLASDDPLAFLALQNQPILFNLLNDERNFYDCGSLEWLAIGIGTSAIIANTHMDQGFRDMYGETFRPANTEYDFLKEFGNGEYVIPALAAIWLVDYGLNSLEDEAGTTWASTAWLQEWSGRSMRGLIVGAVPLLTLQYVIGSNRPSEGSSYWHPFRSTHGVSGHAFVGAIPFWTAAQMTDCCALDVTFYAAGTLAGWSRIHTDSHYLSQVLLGWWLAGLSVASVDHTELQKHQWYAVPTVGDDGAGISLLHLW